MRATSHDKHQERSDFYLTLEIATPKLRVLKTRVNYGKDTQNMSIPLFKLKVQKTLDNNKTGLNLSNENFSDLVRIEGWINVPRVKAGILL